MVATTEVTFNSAPALAGENRVTLRGLSWQGYQDIFWLYMDFREVVERKMLKALRLKLLSVGGRKFIDFRQTEYRSLFTSLTSLIPL